jgi:hypothetical protein
LTAVHAYPQFIDDNVSSGIIFKFTVPNVELEVGDKFVVTLPNAYGLTTTPSCQGDANIPTLNCALSGTILSMSIGNFASGATTAT